MTKPKKNPAIVKESEAKALYFLGRSINEISSTLEVDLKTVEYWHRRGQWHKEKESLYEIIIQDRLSKAADETSRLFTPTVELIAYSVNKKLEYAKANNEPLSIFEIRSLTDVLCNLSKLVKLELRQPTEITENITSTAPLSIEEITQIIKNDEFTTIPVFEVKSDVKQ